MKSAAFEYSRPADIDETIRHWIHQLFRAKNDGDIFGKLVDRFAGIVIQEALDLTRGNQTQAAKLLGLSRPTLQAKIEKYGIKIQTTVNR